MNGIPVKSSEWKLRAQLLMQLTEFLICSEQVNRIWMVLTKQNQNVRVVLFQIVALLISMDNYVVN